MLPTNWHTFISLDIFSVCLSLPHSLLSHTHTLSLTLTPCLSLSHTHTHPKLFSPIDQESKHARQPKAMALSSFFSVTNECKSINNSNNNKSNNNSNNNNNNNERKSINNEGLTLLLPIMSSFIV